MTAPTPPASRAVFLSYASQDAEAVQRIAESLRAAGVEVWFDLNELVGGDAWDQKIRKQIRECALFVPVISANTQVRLEGYFRLEWKLAEDRSHLMAKGKPFLVPVVIDATSERDAHVPDAFLAVQWTRLPAGETSAAFCAQVQRLLGSGVAPVSDRPSEAGHTTHTGQRPALPQATRQPSTPSVAKWSLAAVAALVLAITGYFFLTRQTPAPEKSVAPITASPPPAAPAATSDKSLVVLPLENLSPDPENAFFTDGMHAEITSTLGRIPDLRVISRNSALALKSGGVAISEAARRVNVANVMTGSVRRDGTQVRIQLELRRASDEALLWSQTYKRGVGDQLATQTEIASEVARALQLRDSTGSMQWARLFTQNPDAYDRFLKAVDLYNTPFGGGAKGLATAEECIRRFEEVLRMDPQFSVATSYLSRAHTNAAGRSLDRAARARHAAEAKRLAEEFSRALPGGAGDGALALYYGNNENNYERSLTYAQNVVRALPNDATGYNYLGIALAGLGRSRESASTLRRALEIDPLTSTYWEGLISTLCELREWAEMEQAISRYIAITGSKASAQRIAKARYHQRAEVPKDLPAMDAQLQINMLWTARRFPEALQRCDQVLASGTIDDFQRGEWLVWKCLLLEASNRNEGELVNVRSALAQLMEKYTQVPPDQTVGVRDSLGGGVRLTMNVGIPDNFRRLSAWVFSGLGRGEEAISQIQADIDRLNPKSATRQRWYSETDAAAIYARFGRKPEAIALLRHLLSVPSLVTVPLLRASPDWDPLRDDPAFQALLADPKNSAPL